MTTTLGVTFGAGSAVKRILLFTINVTVLLLGTTCSVLCLYQVKLMPETYDVIVSALLESNLTSATAIPSPTMTATGIRNSGRTTTRTGGSNKGRPRVSRYVSPKDDEASNQQMAVYPVTFMTNLTSSIATGTTRTGDVDVHSLDITKAVALSQTGTTASLTSSSIMAKSSAADSNSPVTRVPVTRTPLMSPTDQTVDFDQVLKNRIAELENELRLMQLTEKVGELIEQENQTSKTVTSWTPSPIEKLNFTDAQISSIAHAITAPVLSWPSILVPTAATQQHREPSQPRITTTPIPTKSSSYPASLVTTSLSAISVPSSPTALLSRTSQQTLAVTSAAKPAEIPITATTTPSKDSTSSTTLALTSTTVPTTFDKVPSTESSKLETSTQPDAAEASLTLLNLTGPDVASPKLQFNTVNASLSNEVQAEFVTSSPEKQVPPTPVKAVTNLPSTLDSLSPSMQTTSPWVTPLMETSLFSTTEKASTSSSVVMLLNQTLSAVSASIPSVPSSTKTISASTTTASSIGFINLTNVIDSISKLVGRRDLFTRRLGKRSLAPTDAPAINSADTLTADHIPIYFERVFFFVQTSLYVCTAAGLLIFFSSLVGICGGLFRIDGCLKFSSAALVLVIMAEMATAAFIFVAHDKASNRNKNKNFDRDLKLLCELASFCVQPILLVITGSFLCISVVLQIGSITLACNLMDNRTETDPGKKMRRMMRSNHSNFQFGAGSMQMNPYSNPMQMPMPMSMPMPMPFCGGGGGGGYGGMNGHLFPFPSPMMMPMQNMGYYPPVFSGPGQRPIVNIIS